MVRLMEWSSSIGKVKCQSKWCRPYDPTGKASGFYKTGDFCRKTKFWPAAVFSVYSNRPSRMCASGLDEWTNRFERYDLNPSD